MKAQTTIVHGPQGCGKTLHAGRIARHLGLDRVIDDWMPGDHPPPKQGVLLLTNEDPTHDPRFRRYRVMDFSAAMAQINSPK